MRLAKAPAEITLVDRRNFHLFQPLTYQVATGALSPGDIAYPLRTIFKRRQNVHVVMAEVADFDLDARRLHAAFRGRRSGARVPALRHAARRRRVALLLLRPRRLGEQAAEVKSLESALVVRSRLLEAFEAAELEPDAARRAEWLTFVVVGAGPTGVEMAGQIAELARDTLHGDFRAIDPRNARIMLVEAADHILTSFPPSLSAKATRSLERSVSRRSSGTW